MSQEQGYQGWKNYETWNVALWIDNDQHMYNTMRESRPHTAKTVCEAAWGFFPHGTRDMQQRTGYATRARARWAARYAMSLVDWQELADHYNAE